ncbi:DNase I-like protein [Rhizophagus irregularis]|uniref:DNase I-like protein n=2 Tax=Rhizophagus irregularis TaxID=588596 RepID=A0A2N1MY60_9GLOM|nr:DNase I-like protein [Rhizophagus irregularis]
MDSNSRSFQLIFTRGVRDVIIMVFICISNIPNSLYNYIAPPKNEGFSLKLLTLNARGLCDMGKNAWLGFEIIKNWDLVGLSETKISEKQIKSEKINPKSIYERYFGYKTHWNYSKTSSSRSSGTAFIYNKALEQYFESIESDNDGRAIMIRFKINNTYLRIIQLYCKTNQRNIKSCTKVDNLKDLILEWVNKGIKENERIIVMGDQNAALNPSQDRKSTRKDKISKPESILIKKLVNEIKLIDIFALRKKDKNVMTYKDISRLDYILLDKKLISNLSDKGIIKNDELKLYTDHAALYLELSF